MGRALGRRRAPRRDDLRDRAVSACRIILILILFFIVGGFFARLLLSKQYRKPLGALAMAALVVVAFGGSAWMWDNLSNDDTVSVDPRGASRSRRRC